MEEYSKWIIRKVNKSDNTNLFEVLSSVMIEFRVPVKGTALSDLELKKMYEAYQSKRSIYFIIEKNVRGLSK